MVLSGEGSSGPSYSAPAVEKALDVLEFLSVASGPVTQNQIAQHVGRSVGQIFRVLVVLEQRGYIARDQESGLYSLTMMMFDVAHRREPLRSLVWLSSAPMRDLSIAVGQSCNLGYRNGDAVTVIAEAASPSDFGFRVRVGASFPLIGSPSGELLLAFGEAPDLDITNAGLPERARNELGDRLRDIRKRGFVQFTDHLHPGVTDLAFPVRAHDGRAIAALTVPYIATSYSQHGQSVVLRELELAARRISDLLSGSRNAADAAPPAEHRGTPDSAS
jgi:DNA-binding IclR family transcriptional regulator